MPPRFAYWTILAGNLPTSFRAAEREDLLPTLRRLQEKHPDAVMMWFQRGKLWESPQAAQAGAREGAPPRGRDWRPGGEHKDPREPFQKRKRERNQLKRQQRFARQRRAETDTGRGGTPAPKRTPDRSRVGRRPTPKSGGGRKR